MRYLLLLLALCACAAEPDPELAGRIAAENCRHLPGAKPVDVTACYLLGSTLEQMKRPGHALPTLAVDRGGVLVPGQ